MRSFLNVFIYEVGTRYSHISIDKENPFIRGFSCKHISYGSTPDVILRAYDSAILHVANPFDAIDYHLVGGTVVTDNNLIGESMDG